MKVCVLAAGGGTRLAPLTDYLPKALLPLPSGQTILANLLTRLTTELPVEEIIIAIGYRGEMIRAAIGPVFNAVPVRYADNADWSTTPNAESLRRARHLLGSATTLLIDGDLVLAPGALRFPDGAGLVLVSDPAAALDAEAMKIWQDNNGTIEMLHKDTMPGTPAGEFIGAALWQDISVLIRALDELPPANIHYYEDGINHLLRQGKIRPAVTTIAPAAWVEVDTAEDYTRAKKLDLDWSPHLMRVVTRHLAQSDLPARLLANALAGSKARRPAPAMLLAETMATLAGLVLMGFAPNPGAGRGAGLVLVAVAQLLQATAGCGPLPPRLARLLRFADRLVDVIVPLLLAGAALHTGPGLLAAASVIAVFFLYYYSSISYLLIMPRTACRTHPEQLARMNLVWLRRGTILPIDRAFLYLIMLMAFLHDPPAWPALAAFAVLACAAWAAQTVLLWRRLSA